MEVINQGWFNGETVLVPMADSIGLLLMDRAKKGVSNQGNNECICSVNAFCSGLNSRTAFYEMSFICWTFAGYKFIQTIRYLVLGVIFLMCGRPRLLKKAIQSGTQTITNVYMVLVGVTGIIKPSWGISLVSYTLKQWMQFKGNSYLEEMGEAEGVNQVRARFQPYLQ